MGLAGISFCEQLERNNQSFKVVTDDSERASLVAGGLYNPVILKRFTLAWKADVQMNLIPEFYKGLEIKLGTKLDHKVKMYRKFASIEEQNLWFEACDKPGLESFLSPAIVKNKNPNIDAPFGFGEVKFTGRIDTERLVKNYFEYLKKRSVIVQESFEYGELFPDKQGWHYKGQSFKHVVFTEGYGLKKNPFFNYLPLNGTKGELLTIKAPKLRENSVIKSAIFSIPLGQATYRVGATYKWKDKTSVPTQTARNELLKKLRILINCDFEVIKHVAGVRPTVADRRPLVGRHPKHENLFVLNGFGSRGVLIAPYASEQLFNHIRTKEKIDPEMDIRRFESKYY